MRIGVFFSLLFLFLSSLLNATDTVELAWRYSAGGKIIGKPVIGPQGAIFFVSEDRYLYSLTEEKQCTWRTWLKDRAAASLAVGYDGTVYAGLKNGTIVAVNRQGDIIWKKRTGGTPVGAPLCYPDGTICIATQEGTVYALSHTGVQKWRREMGSGIDSAPSIDASGMVYVCGNDSTLYALNRYGVIQWRVKTPGQGGRPVPGENAVYQLTSSGVLCRYTGAGDLDWQVSFDGPHVDTHGPLVSGDRVFVLLEDGTVIVLDEEGVEKGRKHIEADPAGSFRCAVDQKGTLYCVTEALRSQLPRAVLPDFGRPVLSESGMLFVAGGDWILYAFETGASMHSPVPEVRENQGTRESWFTPPLVLERQWGDTGDFLYLQHLMASGERGPKKRFLDEVTARVRAGALGASEPYVTGLLIVLAGEGIVTPYYHLTEAARHIPLIRSRAIAILGTLGTFDTAGFFEEMLQYEHDDCVLSAVIQAVGSLRVDPEGTLITTMKEIIEKDSATVCTDRLAEATITSIQKIASYSGVLNYQMRALLLTITKSTYSRNVRAHALEVLQNRELYPDL